MLLDCSRLLQNNLIAFISNTTFANFPDMEYLYVLLFLLLRRYLFLKVHNSLLGTDNTHGNISWIFPHQMEAIVSYDRGKHSYQMRQREYRENK